MRALATKPDAPTPVLRTGWALPVRWPAWLLALLVVGAFGRTLGFDFVGYDDPLNVTENPLLVDPVTASPLPAWQAPVYKLYIPLSYSAWYGLSLIARQGFDASGRRVLKAWPFHAANVLAHFSAVLSVLAILRYLGAGDVAATIGAALFAVHPLQVEAVCWVTGLRDVLGGALALAALRGLLALDARQREDADAGPRWRPLQRPGVLGQSRRGAAEPDRRGAATALARHWHRRVVVQTLATTALGVAAMLAKPGAAALPLLAGVLLVQARRRWRQLLFPVAIWLVAALVTLLMARLAQPGDAAALVDIASSAGLLSRVLQRLLVATVSCGFYLAKLLVPTGLGIDYGLTPAVIARGGWLQPLALVTLGTACGLSTGGIVRRLSVAGSRGALGAPSWLLPAALLGVAGLLPALGLLAFDFQKISTVADRYAYLAMLGPSLLLAGVATRCPRPWLVAVAAVPLVAAGLALPQIARWQSSATLFSHALTVNPASALVYHSQGAALLAAGNGAAATVALTAALRLRPGYEPAVFDLALAQEQGGHYADALVLWQSYPPQLATAAVIEGVARCQRKLGYPAAALATVNAGIARYGERASLHWLHALIAADLGRNGEAETAYVRALAVAPAASDIRTSYGDWLAERGDSAGARREYESVLALHPDDAAVLVNYGVLLAQNGEEAAAEERLRAAVRRAPTLLLAHLNLAQLLAATGRFAAAHGEYQQVLALDPANSVALTAVARLPGVGGKP